MLWKHFILLQVASLLITAYVVDYFVNLFHTILVACSKSDENYEIYTVNYFLIFGLNLYQWQACRRGCSIKKILLFSAPIYIDE